MTGRRAGSGTTTGHSLVAAESISRFAAVLADRSRVAICLALLDGRAWTAGELARAAGIARSTASEHLNVLVAAGLLSEDRQNRHRYLRLAGPHVANFLEDLAAVVGKPERPASLRTVRAAERLAAARTCYDHLAGALGVAVYDALVAAELIGVRDGMVLTDAGRVWFGELAGEQVPLVRTSRPLLRSCLDWTERRQHLAGALGAVLCAQFIQREWVAKNAGDRAVTVTPAGGLALRELLGLEPLLLARLGSQTAS